MSNKPFLSRLVYVAVIIFIAATAGGIWGVISYNNEVNNSFEEDESGYKGASDSSNQNNVDVLKYLPEGAKIGDFNKDVIYADIDGDHQQEMIVFYTIHQADENKANILVLRVNGSNYAPLWEDIYSGSSGFAYPTGVYDLNKNGKLQIVAYRIIGASCPGKLGIYAYENDSIKKISGGWEDTCQSDIEIKDLYGDGTQEIIFRNLKYGVNRDIYRWNGKQYVLSNKKFAQAYGSELGEIVNHIYSQQPIPVSARVAWCQQAVQIYIVKQSYAEAIKVCDDSLKIIDDSALTIPITVLNGNETLEVKNRVAAYFELEKIRAKGNIYRMLGDAQKAAGNLKQAQLDYSKAQMLEDEAREIDHKLPK